MLEIKHLLASTRLLTLTGTGGIGKPRLAPEVAGDYAADFRAAVAVVELAALADPVLVCNALASALTVRQCSRRPDRYPAARTSSSGAEDSTAVKSAASAASHRS